jgi:enoyl-CoA hydratase/carnithine racemase
MDSVITTVVGGVLKIELNRPEKLNAISDEMLDGLRNAIQLAESDAKERSARAATCRTWEKDRPRRRSNVCAERVTP